MRFTLPRAAVEQMVAAALTKRRDGDGGWIVGFSDGNGWSPLFHVVNTSTTGTDDFPYDVYPVERESEHDGNFVYDLLAQNPPMRERSAYLSEVMQDLRHHVASAIIDGLHVEGGWRGQNETVPQMLRDLANEIERERRR